MERQNLRPMLNLGVKFILSNESRQIFIVD